MGNKLILLLTIATLTCLIFVGCNNNDVPVEATADQSTTDITYDITDVTNSTTDVTNGTTDVTNGTTDVTNSTTDETYFVIEEETEETLPDVDTLTLTEYNNLSAEQQQTVIDTFETLDDFFQWYNEVTEDYQEYVEQQINPTVMTENIETTESTTVNVSVPDPNELTLMEYNAMSGEEQMAFANSFDTPADFFAWHTAAKKKQDESLIVIDGTEPIDLTEFEGKD